MRLQPLHCCYHFALQAKLDLEQTFRGRPPGTPISPDGSGGAVNEHQFFAQRRPNESFMTGIREEASPHLSGSTIEASLGATIVANKVPKSIEVPHLLPSMKGRRDASRSMASHP
jgi:hypothetical protein